MSKYRKKPIVIEAIQFKDESEVLIEIQKFMNKELVIDYEHTDLPKLKIATLEGVMEASVDDYIIKGVNGEFYPCKPDIFAKTYDIFDDTESISSGTLSTMTELELIMNVAIEDKVSVGLFIEMPGFDKPEIITNPCVNLPKKLEYYKTTYDDSLEHKHAKGIKIIGYTF